MTKTWDQVKTEAKAHGLLGDAKLDKAKRVTEEHLRAYRLREIRRRADITQYELVDNKHHRRPRTPNCGSPHGPSGV